MSVQVLVKTAPAMNGAYSFLLGSPQEREEFVRQPGIWWYHYPEQDDDWRWHRGGAWRPAHEVTAAGIADGLAAPPLPRGPNPNLVIYGEAAQAGDEDAVQRVKPLAEGEEEDDGRW